MAASLQRNWETKEDTSLSSKTEISVLSYNILAKCNFDESTYPFCPAGHRENSERHPKLMVELKFHKDTDVMCFQEVETTYFHEILKPSLKDLGFDGKHFPKVGSEEGIAIFYKVSTMKFLHHEEIVFEDVLAQATRMHLDASQQEAVTERCQQGSVGLIFNLRHSTSNREISVMNIHLYWKKEFLDLNTLQAAVAVHKLLEAAGSQRGLILCGDFNHTPEQPGYELINTGKIGEKSKQCLQTFSVAGSSLVDLVPSFFQQSLEGLCSTYFDVMGREPSFTVFTDPTTEAWLVFQENSKLDTVKKDESKVKASSTQAKTNLSTFERSSETEHDLPGLPSDISTLDFIWYGTNHLSCKRVLDVVDKEVIKPFWACPNEEFPSDHMLVKAVFVWK